MREVDYRTFLPGGAAEETERLRAVALGREFAARVGRAPTLAEARAMRRLGRVPNREERRGAGGRS